MQDKPILYGNHISTCTNSVKAFLRVSGIQVEFKEVNMMAGETKTEEYKKLNLFIWQRNNFVVFSFEKKKWEPFLVKISENQKLLFW